MKSHDGQIHTSEDRKFSSGDLRGTGTLCVLRRLEGLTARWQRVVALLGVHVHTRTEV